MTAAGHPAWDDPALEDPTDSPRRARYRRKQSWYREVVLGAPPGVDARGKLLGSLLAEEHVAARPDLAFLEETGRYVDQRLALRRPASDMDVDGLRRDLLSPAGVAFNLLASLRDHPRAAARVLRNAFGVEAGQVESLEVDAHLPPGNPCRFDALAVYRTPARTLGFVGMVVRYADAGAHDLGAAVAEARQMLADSPAVLGRVAVLATSDDAATWQAVDALRADPVCADLVTAASYDEVLGSVVQRDGLSGWADAFAARYLDLSVVS